MSKRTIIVASLALIASLCLAAVAGAYANARWKVVASSSDSSEFYAYANTNATIIQPNALALRASGNIETVSWSANCEFERDPARAGVFVMSIPNATKCTVYASATGEGKVTAQILRK